MKSIDNNYIDEIVIQKSRFICELHFIKNELDAKEIIRLIKEKYKGATHYCYAYISNNVKRFSDDGEPGGTAGMPILNVLESNNLNHTLAIVIRYFGGVKLGTGGLVRAYTKAVTTTLSKSNIIELVIGKHVQLLFGYDYSKKIDYLLENYTVIKKEFSSNVIYDVLVPDNNFEDFNASIKPYITEINILEYNIFINEKDYNL